MFVNLFHLALKARLGLHILLNFNSLKVHLLLNYRAPSSENCVDLTFVASHCEKVIFVSDKNISLLLSENSHWTCVVCAYLVGSKI